MVLLGCRCHPATGCLGRRSHAGVRPCRLRLPADGLYGLPAGRQRGPALAPHGFKRDLARQHGGVAGRLAKGGYFLLLWDKGAVVLWERGGAILTPELLASVGWMSALQFMIAASVGWRRGCLFAAAGILILYGYGITQFSVFHMTDYVFFPGIAAYLALTWTGTPGALRWRVSLLSGGLAFGLMWTAVEKFVYPLWTLDVVAEHPDLAFGFPWPFVVVVAGFVEFTLAFYLVTGLLPRDRPRPSPLRGRRVCRHLHRRHPRVRSSGCGRAYSDYRHPGRGLLAGRVSAATAAQAVGTRDHCQCGVGFGIVCGVLGWVLQVVSWAAMDGIRLAGCFSF